MAFTEEKRTSDGKIRRSGDLWGVHKSTPQYRAWRYWQELEFHKRFFSDWITVPDEWPPTTQLKADLFAQWLSDIRDDIPGSALVPRHPVPWNGFTPPASSMQQIDEAPSAMPKGATPQPAPPLQEQPVLRSTARETTDAKELVEALAKRNKEGPVA